MTHVNFYILPHNDALQRNLFACRLLEKAYNLNHQVYLHTQDAQHAEELDRLLWSFSAESFLPHDTNQATAEHSHHPKINIGYDDNSGEHHDVLINLALETPVFFSRFNKVSEIVNQQTEVLSASRKNWAFYQDRGYPLQSHNIR